jgi:hypothetical protein
MVYINLLNISDLDLIFQKIGTRISLKYSELLIKLITEIKMNYFYPKLCFIQSILIVIFDAIFGLFIIKTISGNQS